MFSRRFPRVRFIGRAEATLIVADLHFEKGAAFAARGMLLPPYDTRTTLRRLGALIANCAPRRVVALGDSFHRSELLPLASPCRPGGALSALQHGREWYWVLGNHDPELPASIGGTVCREPRPFAASRLRHEPSAPAATPEIAGHLHPVAQALPGAGKSSAENASQPMAFASSCRPSAPIPAA